MSAPNWLTGWPTALNMAIVPCRRPSSSAPANRPSPRGTCDTHHPLANASINDLTDYPWPKGNDLGRFEGLRKKALMLRNETPYAVVSGISGVVYEICWYMRGLEQWFMDMLEQPEFCEVNRPNCSNLTFERELKCNFAGTDCCCCALFTFDSCGVPGAGTNLAPADQDCATQDCQ